MLPRRGRFGETPGDWREQPHGWNVMTDKGLSPEVLCHHELKKWSVSASTPCLTAIYLH